MPDRPKRPSTPPSEENVRPGVFTAKKPARTGSTREAMELLNDNPRTARLIAWGCHVAVTIALRKRTVHSREVRDEMDRRGLLAATDSEFWIGAVFRKLKDRKVLTWTGHMFTYSDKERNIHERTTKLWELNEAADLTEYRQAPKDDAAPQEAKEAEAPAPEPPKDPEL